MVWPTQRFSVYVLCRIKSVQNICWKVPCLTFSPTVISVCVAARTTKTFHALLKLLIVGGQLVNSNIRAREYLNPATPKQTRRLISLPITLTCQQSATSGLLRSSANEFNSYAMYTVCKVNKLFHTVQLNLLVSLWLCPPAPDFLLSVKSLREIMLTTRAHTHTNTRDPS